MLGVAVSMAVNWRINRYGHDEAQILKKKLPFLEPDPPRDLDSWTASELIDLMPEEVKLAPNVEFHVVKAALSKEKVDDFPIIQREEEILVSGQRVRTGP